MLEMGGPPPIPVQPRESTTDSDFYGLLCWEWPEKETADYQTKTKILGHASWKNMIDAFRNCVHAAVQCQRYIIPDWGF